MLREPSSIHYIEAAGRAYQRYYRFSRQFVREGSEGNIYQPVLTLFDGDFNQLFETDDLPFEKIYGGYFVKDGKLYLFENIRDEMAFIVVDVEER